MDSKQHLSDTEREFRLLKRLAESALRQLSDTDFFQTLDAESNSAAVLVKHLAGNLRSRWTDFLTTDGEKADRQRDLEFVIDSATTRTELMEQWNRGWTTLFDTLHSLSSEDLEGTVTIRGEVHSVPQALLRAQSHYAAHVGQIVLLSKHWLGDAWQTLSIPRGKSDQYSAQPIPYLSPDRG